jgi:hypothetical protein
MGKKDFVFYFMGHAQIKKAAGKKRQRQLKSS